MKSTLRRRVAAAALVLATPLVGACTGTGFDVQTDQQYQPSVGVNEHTGDLDLMNVVLVSPGENRGTLVAGVLNNADRADALTGITGEGIEAIVSPPVQLPSDELVNLAEAGTPVSVAGEGVEPGKFVELTLEFRNGESVDLSVPVVANRGSFSDVPAPVRPRDTTADQSTSDQAAGDGSQGSNGADEGSEGSGADATE